jgi:hypothetical protein
MKTLQLPRYKTSIFVLAAVLFVSTFGTLRAGGPNGALWSPVEWQACTEIVAPFGSSVNDVYSSLRRNAIIGAERSGDVQSGTFSLLFQDHRRQEAIQLIFDNAGRLNGASTWHSTSSAANALEFVRSLTGRLVAHGAKVVTRWNSGVELSSTCSGSVLTVTIGIDAEKDSRAFISVVSEKPTPANGGITENR